MAMLGQEQTASGEMCVLGCSPRDLKVPGNSQHTLWPLEPSAGGTGAGLTQASLGASCQQCPLKELGGGPICLGYLRGVRHRTAKCQDYSCILPVLGKEARGRPHGDQGPGTCGPTPPVDEPWCPQSGLVMYYEE